MIRGHLFDSLQADMWAIPRWSDMDRHNKSLKHAHKETKAQKQGDIQQHTKSPPKSIWKTFTEIVKML